MSNVIALSTVAPVALNDNERGTVALPRFPFGAFRAIVAGILPTLPPGATVAYILRTTARGGASYHPIAFLPSAIRANLARYTDTDGSPIRFFTDRGNDGSVNPTYDEIDRNGLTHVQLDAIIARGYVLPSDGVAILGQRGRTFAGAVKTRFGLVPVAPAVAPAPVAVAPVAPSTPPIDPATAVAGFFPDPTPVAPAADPAPTARPRGRRNAT